MITFNSFYLTDLRVEHMTNALGIENPLPRFSWKLNSNNKNVVQAAYRIQITESEQEPTPSTMEAQRDGEHAADDGYVNGTRDFHEFRPAQYIRIPFTIKKTC